MKTYHKCPELDLYQSGLGDLELSGNPEKAQTQVFKYIWLITRQKVSKDTLKLINGIEPIIEQSKHLKIYIYKNQI